jgi:Fe-S cluster assembly protein SufD
MSIATLKSASPDLWTPRGTAPLWQAAPSWLKQQQSDALSKYQQQGLPGIRDEEWRLTNLRALKETELEFISSDLTAVSLPQGQTPRLVFVNGHFNAGLSTVTDLPDVTAIDLKSAVLEEPDAVQALYGTALPKLQHGFTLQNTAYANDGYVVILPKNIELSTAIEIIFINDGRKPSATHNRNLIIASENSKCTVIERHIGAANEASPNQYLNNSVTEIHASDGAKVDHYKLQQESSAAFHMGGIFIRQARASEVKTHSFALSGKLLRNDLLVNLEGEGAHVEMNGLVLGDAEQHIDNHTQVNHAVANCTSDEYYKTILDDKSRSVFRGRIIVAQDAQLTVADQQNNNLLLSEFAEADSKPQLEIYADDVKCSHGATVGQLDQKALFYLQSRGIDLTSAKALLTFAFANEVVERINISAVREELSTLLAGQLVSEVGDLL